MHRHRLMLSVLAACFFTVRCGSKAGNVTGPPGAIAEVRIDPAAATIPAGQTSAGLFHATALDASGAALQNKSFTWASSNTAVATVAGGVGAQGNPITVAGVAGGTVTISAGSEGVTGAAHLTVQVSAHPGVVTGRVYDATSPTQAGIAGATVGFKDVLGAPLANNVTTSADGSYTSPDLTGSVTLIADVTAQATGYVGTTLYSTSVPLPDQTLTLEPIPLVPASTQPGGINGTARNARDNTGIANAEVNLYRGTGGAGAALGHSSIGTATADGSGGFSFTALAAGTYTLSVTANGFSTGSRTAIAVGNNGVTANQDVSLSPSGALDIRIVLTWGANPSDLDAHLTGPNADASRFHVYYPPSSRGNLTAPPFALLDVDDTESFGPETITITQLNSGTYRFSVHDFSNSSSASSTALGSSGAKVELYTAGGLRQTFFVPNQAGTLWTVFELTGPDITNPTVIPRNEMGFAEDPAGILDARPGTGTKGRETDAKLIARSTRALEKKRAH